MKTSTLLSMALVSVSCYAVPLHTSSTDENTAAVQALRAALRVNAAPVSPPAPDIVAQKPRPCALASCAHAKVAHSEPRHGQPDDSGPNLSGIFNS